VTALFKPLVVIATVSSIVLGCASAPAEAAVWHVNPTHAKASDSGPGTPAVPLKTVAEAMRRIQPGDTVRLAAGTYREPILLPRRAWSATRATVVEGSGNPAAVVVKGSRVLGGWQASGPGRLALHLPQEPQQVFVAGRPLKQVGGTIFGGFPESPQHELARLHVSQGGIWPGRIAGDAQSLAEDSFHYDRRTQTLHVRSRTAAVDGRNVEVSVEPHLLLADEVDSLTIRNLTFEHSSTTTTSRRGAVALSGRRIVVERIAVRQADGKCLSLAADDSVIRRSSFDECGQLGIGARGRRVLVEANTVRSNNTRGFNKWWEAGGMKFVGAGGLQESRVRGNLVASNTGDGIWFDWGNRDNVVSGNISAFNSGFGIHYEASADATIADNRVYGNGQRGIYAPDSNGVAVLHNFVAANGLDGIALVKERKDVGSGDIDFRPFGNVVVGNLVAWNKGSAIVLPGPEYMAASDWNVLVESASAPARMSMGWPKSGRDRRALPDWMAAFGVDTNSRVHAAEPSAAVLQHLQRRTTALPVPWPEVRAFASGLRVPPVQGRAGIDGVSAGGGAPAGPRN
jgi:parallel beta-helix repeat protein